MRHSVVFRLIAGLIVGGLLMSAGLVLLGLQRVDTIAQMQVTQQAVLTTRNIQSALQGVFNEALPSPFPKPQAIYKRVSSLILLDITPAVRIRIPGQVPVSFGIWPDEQNNHFLVWPLSEHSIITGHEVDMSGLTLIQAPLELNGHRITLEILVDGNAALWRIRCEVFNQMVLFWIFLGALVLLGLICLRRWFTTPLTELLRLVNTHAGPESFYRIARENRTEFARLSEAIGGMLTRLETTADRLRQREQAFENLYQQAPAPLISLDAKGMILDANRRAEKMLQRVAAEQMVGRHVQEFIHVEDRPVLRQAIARLHVHDTARCEIRLTQQGQSVILECAAIRNEQGDLQRLRLALLDVSEQQQLQTRLQEHNRLMDLLVNHMSDGILLIDQENRIVTCNKRLAMLLHSTAESLEGQHYDPEQFWQELDILNYDAFIKRIQQITVDHDRSIRERFDTRVGTFLFHGIPVKDADSQTVMRLWVIADITSQVQSQKLVIQQTQQLQGLKLLGQKLFEVNRTDQLFTMAGTQLYDIFHVEAVGIALRSSETHTRSRQIIHRGNGPYLLEPNRRLVQSIEKYFMPQILSDRQVTYWPDTPRSTRWGKDFWRAGITSLAACPLVGHADPQGILWIARRGGERLERHHLYLLEALAPMIASRLEIARLGNRLSSLQLTDPITGLPNRQHMLYELRKWVQAPASVIEQGPHQAALCVIRLDHYDTFKTHLDKTALRNLLKKISVLLRRHARCSCIVGRLTGPDFAIFCPQVTPDVATSIAQRLCQAVAGQRLKLPHLPKESMTASLGLVCLPQDGEDPVSLLNLAMDRTEMAVRSGRNQVVTPRQFTGGKQVG